MRLPQFIAIYGNLPYSAMFCHILPTCFYRNICDIRNVRNFCQILLSLLNSAKFCQDYDLKPILPHTYVNWVIKLIIYTLFSCFLISFPYVMSWFYHIVHIRSLIISTLLYIIVTCTYFVTVIPFPSLYNVLFFTKAIPLDLNRIYIIPLNLLWSLFMPL